LISAKLNAILPVVGHYFQVTGCCKNPVEIAGTTSDKAMLASSHHKV